MKVWNVVCFPNDEYEVFSDALLKKLQLRWIAFHWWAVTPSGSMEIAFYVHQSYLWFSDQRRNWSGTGWKQNYFLSGKFGLERPRLLPPSTSGSLLHHCKAKENSFKIFFLIFHFTLDYTDLTNFPRKKQKSAVSRCTFNILSCTLDFWEVLPSLFWISYTKNKDSSI